MNKVIIISLVSAIISLPYLIDFLGEGKAIIRFESLTTQKIVQPTTDKSLSNRKPINTHDWEVRDNASQAALVEQTQDTDTITSSITALRAEHIETLRLSIDPQIDEIHRSLQRMETISFSQKEKYQKNARIRLLELEELKASIAPADISAVD